MGGHGSGRSESWNARDTTEGCLALDVRLLARKGWLARTDYLSLSWTQGERQTGAIGVLVEADRLALHYRSRERGGDWQDVAEWVDLVRTPCHYGGERVWFRCPRRGRRVAVLYAPGRLFWCRTCYGLAYASQKESPRDRALSKMQAIRRRLGGTQAPVSPFPDKPRGMHWDTYHRLMTEYIAADGVYGAEVMRWLAGCDAWLAKAAAGSARRGAPGSP